MPIHVQITYRNGILIPEKPLPFLDGERFQANIETKGSLQLEQISTATSRANGEQLHSLAEFALSQISELDFSKYAFDKLDVSSLAVVLTQMVNLRTASFYRPQVGELHLGEFFRTLRCLPRLQSLKVVNASLRKVAIQALREGLANVSLQDLDLNRNGIGGDCSAELAKLLQAQDALLTLNLDRNPFGKGSLGIIAEGLTSKDLLALQLSGCDFAEQDGPDLSAALRKLNALQLLDVSHNAWGLEVESIAEALMETRGLTILSLASCKIGDHIPKLAKAIASLPILKSLDLSRNDLLDTGAASIGAALLNIRDLSVLDLSSNDISELEALSLGIGSQSYLDRLFLDDNRIGPRHMNKLATALVTTTLRRLSMRNNRIGDEGCESLAVAIHEMPLIQELDLSGNGISSGIKSLVSALSGKMQFQKLDLSFNQIGPKSGPYLAGLRDQHSIQELNLSLNAINDKTLRLIAAELREHPSLRRVALAGNPFVDIPSEVIDTEEAQLIFEYALQ